MKRKAKINMKNSFINKLRSYCAAFHFGGADHAACFCAAFVFVSLIFASGGSFTDLTYVRQSSAAFFAAGVITAWIAIFAVSMLLKTTAFVRIFLGAVSVAFAALLCVSEPENIWFNIGLAFVLVLIAKYIFSGGGRLPEIKLSPRVSLLCTVGIFLAFFVFVSYCTVLKYASFRHGAFDFGIFCQMFEQMAKTGAPMTTVERSRYLSHFAVHFSPVYYLLLPGYMIFRSPVYLLIAQAAVVGAGVFPVRRICRALGMEEGVGVFAAALYAFFPTMSNGCFYDFHENKFLAGFLLYLVAFVLENKKVGIIIFALLTLSVKEDAFIYVLAVALWMIVSGRNRRLAAVMSVFSIGYFFFACEMIQLCGGEIMSGRFANYSADDNGGLADAVKTCFMDIGYLIREVFSGADTEAFSEVTYGGQKLEFVMWTAAPLLFTPFLRKKSRELVLLVPLLVINLMPSWMYQSNIDYQYTYGTAALMIASALMFVSECKPHRRQALVCTMLMISIVFSVSAQCGKVNAAIGGYSSHSTRYSETAKTLKENIPEDSSVTAYGYMIPHLYYIDDLHSCPEYYGEYEKTDFYVIDTRYAGDDHTKKMLRAMGDDYELLMSAGYAEIYRREDAAKNGK